MSENHPADAPDAAASTTESATTTEAATTEAPTSEAPSAELPTSEAPVAEPPTTGEPTAPDAAPLLKKAGLQFLGAVAAAIIAAGWALKVVEDGGSIRYYIFILPLVLFVGALNSYRGARKLGGTVRTPILAVAVVAAVVAVAAVGYSAKAALLDGPSVDSCWHDESATDVVQVDCGSEKADWVATSEVTDPMECEQAIDGRDGYYLCLQPK